MNDTIKNIITRRSIRKYTKEEVSKDDIKLLLTAAMHAPSACNQQDWHFYVITEHSKLTKLSSLHSGLRFVKDAPVAILVCSNPENVTLDYYWIDDCAAATQNILLAAKSLGLGATWTGINHNDPVAVDFYRKTIGVPAQYVPFALIPVGHPVETSKEVDRYDEGKVSWRG